MSIVFVPEKLRGRAQINQEIIQRLLEENDQLVRIIVEYQRKGRAAECVRYQQILHRNLVYLATIADTSPNILPAAPTTPAENMGICAAAQVQSEESKSLSPPAGKENTDTWGGTQ
ncbi:SS18-like protein 2 [Huso huso]|uniref:SS18-like protein 2 n=1 Tax=Huso huso TaxID=61971 RepID=A0ABR0YXK8_HUSHU